MHIKTVRVTNPKNVLVQIPKTIVEIWGLEDKDGIEVHVDEETKELTLKPRKGYTKIFTRINTNKEG